MGERWALVLPYDATRADRGSASNFVARDFFVGFKLGIAQHSNADWPIQLDLYDFNEENLTFVDSQGEGALPLSVSEFMAEQSDRGVRLVIGPFRGKDSETLAKYADSNVFVINPLSRDVSIDGLPQLIAASPSRYLESEILGRLLAIEVEKRPSWKSIVFYSDNSLSTSQMHALSKGFREMGGDTNTLNIRSFDNTTSITEYVHRLSRDSARFILLDDNMYHNAVLLKALSKRPSDATEFWSQGSVVNNPSVDAFLLLRQILVWAQPDHLEFADFHEVEASISEKLGDSNSRWAWLGYDLAVMLANDNPDSFSGPKRNYMWRHVESGGQFNEAVSVYRYIPGQGVNPVELPLLPLIVE